ncbi:MAG: hypothetical protein WCQ69_07020 [Bacteroidales bacterium]|jgi:hypothetical protein|nr:hypothetical protein [Bacteroidales bacterium]MDD2265157.1 hypothetical protein [Bacteroidales bacterium]MDD2832331.1 hypothetical protein [Bacteroidales bacterium]MDD3209525.1 hypothetical protein [Bacteroidales bacterium]MDD3698096.1 hypothetical protein [Bacteroidales bacterium]
MKYDKEKYKIWNWKNPVILHWIINPGLVINELIFGQTIPKVMLIEREGKKPFYQRSLIPCPHCGTMHSGLKWSMKNKTAFKNWFGYYCDNCKEIIPVQRNLTALIILTVTFPIWGWFRKILKQNWLDKQPDRYKNINLEIPEKKNSTKNWLKSGLFFGIFMFVSVVIIYPLIKGSEITSKSILIGIPLWLICGLVWGYTNKILMNKKGKENKDHNNV